MGLPVLLSGEVFPERPMFTGKTLFAQLMDFLPWTTFARIVERYGGDRTRLLGLPHRATPPSVTWSHNPVRRPYAAEFDVVAAPCARRLRAARVHAHPRIGVLRCDLLASGGNNLYIVNPSYQTVPPKKDLDASFKYLDIFG